MEEQSLQPVPEVVDGSLVEETEIGTEDRKVKKDEVRMEDEAKDDEEFYERIEAPKFVDFTKPYNFRTDDRYWFCSRVGCDRRHEEEINPEEISKNFVLRVLAARSPNIKLRKALNRDNLSLKCPLSAPAKPSKPRIPRLIPEKNCSKVGSTPVAKTRQVAAKYMTTPRNKVCHPNPKTTTVDVPKNPTVAKALIFRSPKKAVILKKSVELHTPLTKICEGMKRFGISSQKKTLKVSKPKKLESEESSRRQCGSEKKSKDLAPSKSTKTQNKKTPTYKCELLHELVVVDAKLSDGSTSDFSKKNDLHPRKTSDTSYSHILGAETKDLLNIEDKENMASAEDLKHSNKVEAGFGSEQIEDGKENSLNPQDNNRSNNLPLGDKILSKEMHKKNKVAQLAGPGLTKCKKPKPTSIKPFRLRTDERGILKEANLEKKLHNPAPKKDVAKDTSGTKMTYRVPKNEKFSTGDNGGKESGPNTARSTQQRSMTSLRTRSQRVVSPKKVRMAGQQLGVIDEKSSKLPSDATVEANKSRAVSAARSTSRGKRPVTIAREPNFHTSHLPRTCSKKVA